MNAALLMALCPPPVLPFSPEQIAGCQFGIRSDTLVSLDPTNVQQWNDLSGRARNLAQATSAKRPTYVASSTLLGNKPSIQSTTAPRFLAAATASDWNFCHNGSGFTLYGVFRTQGPNGSFIVTTQTNSGLNVGFSIQPLATNALRFVVGNSTQTVIALNTANGTLTTTAAHIVIVKYSTSAGAIIRIDRASAGTQAQQNAPSASNGGVFTIGAGTTGLAPTNNDFGCCFLFNNITSGTSDTNFENWCNTEFGL